MYSARRGSPPDHVASPTTVLNQFLEQEDSGPYRTPFSPAHGGAGAGVPRCEERREHSGIKQALQAEYERRCREMMSQAEATRRGNDDELSDLIVGGDTATYLNILSKARRPVSEEHTARRSNNRCDPQPAASRFGDMLAEELLTPRSSAAELRTQLDRAIRQRDEAQHNAAKAEALLKYQTELAAHKLSTVEAERDEAIMQLVLSQEDVHALRAQMEDAALYIASLKRRNAQMELAALSALHQRDEAAAEAAYYEQGAEAAFEYAANAARSVNSDTSGEDNVFSITNIKNSIEKAVQDMAALPEEEQRKKIKQLRLRWHPDKNPVLGEFAAEVTKIINDCVEKLKSSSTTSQGEEQEPAAAAAGCEEVAPRTSRERQDETKRLPDESVGLGGVLTIRNT